MMGENKGLNTAYRKGVAAYDEGKTISDCPYEDKRTYHGAVTWSRAYIRAWISGWKDAKRLEKWNIENASSKNQEDLKIHSTPP